MRSDLLASADAVVVGGGTVGGWCAYFLCEAGVRNVVLLEQSTVGSGASSRAAGIVRCQGGTPVAVRLGMWSRDFYRSQADLLPLDSGFVAQGYFMPCFTDAEVEAAKERMAMHRGLGLEVSWLDPDEAAEVNPTMAHGTHLGGTFAPGDGYIDPARNVLAYTLACITSGVRLFEHVRFEGVESAAGRVTAVVTDAGPIATPVVVLTGGPQIAATAATCGVVIPVAGTRHQVALTEPHRAFEPCGFPMVFDVPSGLYWRPEERGLLFGMSNPDEQIGEARSVDWPYLKAMHRRLAELVPIARDLELKKVWAATIDYSPDHLPIIGPGLVRRGGPLTHHLASASAGVEESGTAKETDPGEPVAGLIVASPAGHGMMWGPAVARAAADLATSGATDVVDTSSLGLERFDTEGRSSLDPDPIALPFPERTS